MPSELLPKEKNILSSTESFPARCQRRKTNKGGLSDAEDKSGARIFAVPESAKFPMKTRKKKNYLSHLNPKLDCLFPSVHEKLEALRRGLSVVLQFAARSEHSWFDVEINELSSRNPAPPHESLPQSNFSDRPL